MQGPSPSSTLEKVISKVSDRTLVIAGFCIIGLWYMIQVNPHPGFHDSLTYIFRAAEGFQWLTHATAHFLWLNLIHFQYELFGESHHIIANNLTSVAFGFLALLLLYKLLREYETPPLTALGGIVALALSYTWMSQSMSLEAYAMSNVLFAAYFWLAFRDIKNQQRQYILPVAVLVGVGLLTHIQHVLSLPFMLYYFLSGPVRATRRIMGFFILGAAFFILAIPPLFMDAHPLMAIFFDFGFREEVLAYSPSVIAGGIARGGAYWVYNFTIFCPLILWAAYRMYHSEPQLLYYLLLLFLPYLLFAARYNIPDVYTYYLIPYIGMTFLVAHGIKYLRFPRKSLVILVFLCMLFKPLFYYSVTQIAPYIPQLEQFGEPKSYKCGYDYYFWPGRANAPDPLERAQYLYHEGSEEEICYAQHEWNLRRAWDYLYLHEQIGPVEEKLCDEE